MKTLLILVTILLFVSCGELDKDVPSNTTNMVDEAIDVFTFNKEILEDEVMFGALCLVLLTETGTQKNDICEIYNITKERAIIMSALGLEIFTGLVNGGYLIDKETYSEVIDIITRLSNVQIRAKNLRKEIEDMSGSK